MILKWILRNKLDSFTVHDCYESVRRQKLFSEGVANVEEGVKELESRFYIRADEPAPTGKRGRPASTTYYVNPNALKA